MISTIGYEGASLDDFIRSLKLAHVEIVIDVRERAQSRRPGFSKSALIAALAGAGIDYEHFPELGDPKAGREAARAGDWSNFRRIYFGIVKKPEAVAAITEIVEIEASMHACLLCYERDPFTCHRKIITDIIQESEGISSTHLGVKKFGTSESGSRRVLHSRESATASI